MRIGQGVRLAHRASLPSQRQPWRHAVEECPKGFKVNPRHGVVEHTFAWLLRSLRLARDDKQPSEIRVAMIDTVMTHIILRCGAI